MQQERSDSAHNAGLAMVFHARWDVELKSDATLAQVVQEHGEDYASYIADAYAYRGEGD
jgi:hypothetical protein